MTAIGSHPVEPAATIAIALSRPQAPALQALPARIELRWSCTAACCALEQNGGAGPGIHDRADLIVRLERLDGATAVIEAYLWSAAGLRREVCSRRQVRCVVRRDGRWLHLDVADAEAGFDGPPILKLSLGEDSAVGYVHTPLLARAGLPGGSYDRPCARCGNAC